MTKLPIPPTPVGTEIIAIALSPDGTKLAVASERPDHRHYQASSSYCGVLGGHGGGAAHLVVAG